MLEMCPTVVFITCTQILAERHTLRRINGLIALPPSQYLAFTH